MMMKKKNQIKLLNNYNNMYTIFNLKMMIILIIEIYNCNNDEFSLFHNNVLLYCIKTTF